MGERRERVPPRTFDEQVADHQERVWRENEREAAFEEKARAVSEEMSAA